MYISRSTKFVAAVVFLVLFLILMGLLTVVDVDAIGPEGTSVGFSKINGGFATLFPFNKGWYFLSKVVGLAAIVIAGFFALVGLLQLIKRKSLKEVDSPILFLAGLYAITIGLYILFNHVTINYRPVLVPGEEVLEPSFPSSHAMLAVVVFGSAVMLFGIYLKGMTIKYVIQGLCWICLMLTVVSRALSGVHWFTDIIGGLFLAMALLSLYSGFICESRKKTSRVR